MNKILIEAGQGGNARQTFLHFQSAIQSAVAHLLSDFTTDAAGFKVSGCDVTESTVSGVTTVSVAAGVACLAGEIYEVPASSITREAAEVAWLAPFSEFVDATPVTNIEGVSAGNQIKATLMLFKGVNFPAAGQFLPLNAPTQLGLLETKLQSKLLRKGVMYPIDTDDIPLIPTNWSTTGLGQSGTPAAGLAICNGLNGTIDMRGVSPIGATLSEYSAGAGAQPLGVTSTYTVEQVVGAESVILTVPQLPEHTHTYGDRGLISPGAEVQSGNSFNRVPNSGEISGSTGDGEGHENRQPSRALVWVKVVS